MALLSLADGVAFYRVLATGAIASPAVVPASLLVTALCLALAGVPPAAVELDELGNSTALTASNVARRLGAGERVLLVTHYFHLPRTALLFHREGLRSFTLSARMTRRLMQEPAHTSICGTRSAAWGTLVG